MFRAYEPGRDRLVAIKVFRFDLTPEQAAALVRELDAIIAANIAHPHIAAPVAAGLAEGAAYLAQEFAVGDSLDVMVRERGPLPVEDVVPMVDSLASAIDHAASRGVGHGALHMRDIIVSPDGVRIAGFGVAPALAKVGVRWPTRPQYAAPDGPSDVYALAAIAFEAMSGKRASPDNLKAFEAAHGAQLRGAFTVALATRDLRPVRAGDFADVLRDAAAMSAPAAAPDLELRIEPRTDLMADASHDPADRIIAEPPRALQATDSHDPHTTPRWPIVVTFLLFGILTALSVGFFLRTRTPTAQTAPTSAVEETTVDLPPPTKPEPPAARTPAPPAAKTAPVEKPARGSLLIRSTPADADVLVNGRPSGKTPVAVRDLALGSYTIRVAREGYATEEQKLELTARRPAAATMFNLRPAKSRAGVDDGLGRMVVQSRPPGARVFVDDRLVGKTPLSMPEVPAGSARVRIELDGYRPWITTVRVDSGGQARVAASLERK